MNAFFDVLDTLVDESGTPRPHFREVFLELAKMGHNVYLWSSGGKDEPLGIWAAPSSWPILREK